MIIIEKRHLQYSRNSRCAEGLLQISSRWCWNELVIYGLEVNKNSQIIRFCNRLYPCKLYLTMNSKILISANRRLMRFLSEKLNIPPRGTMSAGQCEMCDNFKRTFPNYIHILPIFPSKTVLTLWICLFTCLYCSLIAFRWLMMRKI